MNSEAHGMPKLVGSELLNKLSELKNLPKNEIVKACGYYKKQAGEKEIIDFAEFYEAILEAKGIDTPEDSRTNERINEGTINIAKSGEALVKLPYGCKNLKPKNIALIEQHEWDNYGPGHPLQISLVSKSQNEPSYVKNQTIKFNSDGFLVLQSQYFLRGERYCLEPEEDFTFQLEPMPWNGIDASITENLRLLIIPEHSVQDLLMLCNEHQEDLFDMDNFGSFEEHLTFALENAILNLNTKEAVDLFSLFGWTIDDAKALVEKNWKQQELLKDKTKLQVIIDQFLN